MFGKVNSKIAQKGGGILEIKYYLALVVVLLVFGIVIWKTLKKLRWDAKFHKERNERLHEVNHKLRDELNEVKRNNKNLEVSISNLKNALNHKTEETFKKHFFTCNLEEGQTIVILFEEETEHNTELQEKLIQMGLNPKKHSRKLECVVFVDGKKEMPLLIDDIYAGEVKAKIGDINCGNYKNRGIGSLIVQNLCDVLKRMGVESLSASLSPVDYHNKEKLYNFYLMKNKFDLIRELTKDKWGLVSKKIS